MCWSVAVRASLGGVSSVLHLLISLVHLHCRGLERAANADRKYPKLLPSPPLRSFHLCLPVLYSPPLLDVLLFAASDWRGQARRACSYSILSFSQVRCKVAFAGGDPGGLLVFKTTPAVLTGGRKVSQDLSCLVWILFIIILVTACAKTFPKTLDLDPGHLSLSVNLGRATGVSCVY